MTRLSREEVEEVILGIYENFDPLGGAWFVYMLRCADGSLYTGVTNNLPNRLRAHNAGRGSKYVRSRLPASLAWSRVVGDKGDALREEARIKGLPKAKKEAMLRWGTGPDGNEMLRLHLEAAPPPPEGLDRVSALSMSLALSDHDCWDVRDALVHRYAWSTPTEEALREVMAHGPVVEMGAGAGYWTWLMRGLGGSVVALDKHADGSLNMWNPSGHTWTEVMCGEPRHLAGYRDRTLFLCWPILGGMAAQCLREWRGEVLVYIGDPRFTADEEFHEALSDSYVRVKVVEMPSWPTVDDRLEVWKRIKASP